MCFVINAPDSATYIEWYSVCVCVFVYCVCVCGERLSECVWIVCVRERLSEFCLVISVENLLSPTPSLWCALF